MGLGENEPADSALVKELPALRRMRWLARSSGSSHTWDRWPRLQARDSDADPAATSGGTSARRPPRAGRPFPRPLEHRNPPCRCWLGLGRGVSWGEHPGRWHPACGLAVRRGIRQRRGEPGRRLKTWAHPGHRAAGTAIPPVPAPTARTPGRLARLPPTTPGWNALRLRTRPSWRSTASTATRPWPPPSRSLSTGPRTPSTGARTGSKPGHDRQRL